MIVNQGQSRQELADKGLKIITTFKASYFLSLVFRAEHVRETAGRRFWCRVAALLIKRWHVLRRQYIFILGFFLLPVLVEILIVSVLPTPQSIQASLTQNDRVKDAQVTLTPSIYNPHTIVSYSNNYGNNARQNLISFIQNTNATSDEISTDTVLDYVDGKYLVTEDAFINTYQMAFALYNNLTSSVPSLTFTSYYSTVNFHAMATSLSVGSTNLFQFYANSSTKKITTTNQPVLTTATSSSFGERFFEIIYCFDTIPLSLFNFINSIVAAIFISILIVPLIEDRVTHSKDLQLLTNLSKGTYWFSNVIFDLSACLILCILLTIVVKVKIIFFSLMTTSVSYYHAFFFSDWRSSKFKYTS
jgi:hypothetical protein